MLKQHIPGTLPCLGPPRRMTLLNIVPRATLAILTATAMLAAVLLTGIWQGAVAIGGASPTGIVGVGRGSELAGALANSVPLCGRHFHSPTHLHFPLILQVGARPGTVLVSERSSHAFLTNSDEIGYGVKTRCGASVTTFDVRTGRVLRITSLPLSVPHPILDEEHGRLIVFGYAQALPSGAGEGAMIVLDLRGRVIVPVHTFSLGPPPCNGCSAAFQVALDTRTGRAFLWTFGNLVTLDVADVHVLNTVPINIQDTGGFPGFGLDAQHGRVLVASSTGVTILDAVTGAVVQTLGLGDGERGLAVDERAGTFFVDAYTGAAGCRSGGPMNVLQVGDTVTGKTTPTALSSCGAFSPVIVDEPAQRVLAQSQQLAGTPPFTALDARSGAVVGEPPSWPAYQLSRSLSQAVERVSGRLYFLSYGCSAPSRSCANRLFGLDPETWKLVRNVPIPRQRGLTIAFAQREHRIFVTNYYYGTMTILRQVP